MPSKTTLSRAPASAKGESAAAKSKLSRGESRQTTTAAKSVEKAKVAFKDFSLSKFAGSKVPENYVQRQENPHPARQQSISTQIGRVPEEVIARRVMSFALPPAILRELAPSFDPKAKTAKLADITKLLSKHMRGTEFVVQGNPALNRLMIQAEVDKIISDIKGGSKK